MGGNISVKTPAPASTAQPLIPPPPKMQPKATSPLTQPNAPTVIAPENGTAPIALPKPAAKPIEVLTLVGGLYQVGPPTRPNIVQDNGFLSNRKDPSDPRPIPVTKPGVGDYAALAKGLAKLTAVQEVQGVPGLPHNDIPDGIKLYQHFLGCSGKPVLVDYNRFLTEDPSGKIAARSAALDLGAASEKAYALKCAQDPSAAKKPMTFQISGPALKVGGDDKFPYPRSENWQKTIGAHAMWTSADVTVTPDPEGGPPNYTLKMVLHMEDRYNFNRGASDVASHQPDSENGQLELCGLGKQFDVSGVATRTVSWTSTKREAATITE